MCLAKSVSESKWVKSAVTLQIMCVSFWAGVTYLGYTALMIFKNDETPVYCCDPAVLVCLVSRNVFYVVSVLKSIVCLYIY